MVVSSNGIVLIHEHSDVHWEWVIMFFLICVCPFVWAYVYMLYNTVQICTMHMMAGLNPTKHLWDKLKPRLHQIINVAEWK